MYLFFLGMIVLDVQKFSVNVRVTPRCSRLGSRCGPALPLASSRNVARPKTVCWACGALEVERTLGSAHALV